VRLTPCGGSAVPLAGTILKAAYLGSHLGTRWAPPSAAVRRRERRGGPLPSARESRSASPAARQRRGAGPKRRKPVELVARQPARMSRDSHRGTPRRGQPDGTRYLGGRVAALRVADIAREQEDVGICGDLDVLSET
jgi:hypothetical protein